MLCGASLMGADLQGGSARVVARIAFVSLLELRVVSWLHLLLLGRWLVESGYISLVSSTELVKQLDINLLSTIPLPSTSLSSLSLLTP